MYVFKKCFGEKKPIKFTNYFKIHKHKETFTQRKNLENPQVSEVDLIPPNEKNKLPNQSGFVRNFSTFYGKFSPPITTNQSRQKSHKTSFRQIEHMKRELESTTRKFNKNKAHQWNDVSDDLIKNIKKSKSLQNESKRSTRQYRLLTPKILKNHNPVKEKTNKMERNKNIVKKTEGEKVCNYKKEKIKSLKPVVVNTSEKVRLKKEIKKRESGDVPSKQPKPKTNKGSIKDPIEEELKEKVRNALDINKINLEKTPSCSKIVDPKIINTENTKTPSKNAKPVEQFNPQNLKITPKVAPSQSPKIETITTSLPQNNSSPQVPSVNKKIHEGLIQTKNSNKQISDMIQKERAALKALKASGKEQQINYQKAKKNFFKMKSLSKDDSDPPKLLPKKNPQNVKKMDLNASLSKDSSDPPKLLPKKDPQNVKKMDLNASLKPKLNNIDNKKNDDKQKMHQKPRTIDKTDGKTEKVALPLNKIQNEPSIDHNATKNKVDVKTTVLEEQCQDFCFLKSTNPKKAHTTNVNTVSHPILGLNLKKYYLELDDDLKNLDLTQHLDDQGEEDFLNKITSPPRAVSHGDCQD